MKLIRIRDGVEVEVTVPNTIVLSRGVRNGDVFLLQEWKATPEDPDWNSALQSWAYRNGYEVPEIISK